MDTCFPILLPYGLSSQYQDILRGRKDTPVRFGLPQYRTATLLEISRALNPFDPHQFLPTLGRTGNPRQPIRQHKPDYPRQKEGNMGFQRNIKKIDMDPATGKEKRGRAKRKPQISVRKLLKAGSEYSPGFRVGASQELPITLDSDDDAPTSNPQR